MWIVNLVTAGFLIGLGIIIRVFKTGFLVAGYNTASTKEKAKYDETKLTRFVGNLLVYTSLILIAGGILCLLNVAAEFMMIMSWVLWTVAILAGVIYMNVKHVKK